MNGICDKITQSSLWQSGKAFFERVASSRFCVLMGNIGTSKIARLAFSSIKENLAEEGGNQLGCLMVAPVGALIGSEMGRFSGQITAISLSVLGAKMGAEQIHRARRSRDSPIHVLVLGAAAVALFSAIFQLTSEPMVNLGESVGSSIGEFVYGTIGSILVAFGAIKLFGSDEKLWDSESPLRSYPVKYMQSNAMVAFHAALGNVSSNSLKNFLDTFILSSLAFNFLDLKKWLSKLKEGTLLDQRLLSPSHLQFSHRATNALAGLIASKITLELRRNVPQSEHYPDWAIQLALGPIVENVKQRLEQELRSLPLNQSPEVRRLLKQLETFSFHTLVRTVNRYFELDQTLVPIFDYIERFDEIWTDPAFQQLKPYVKHYIPILSALGPSSAERAAEHLVEALSTLERKIVGFEFLSQDRKQQITRELQKLCLGIIRTVPLVLAENNLTPCSVEEIRAFHKHLNFLVAGYYTAAGYPIVQIAQNFLDYQLDHSTP